VVDGWGLRRRIEKKREEDGCRCGVVGRMDGEGWIELAGGRAGVVMDNVSAGKFKVKQAAVGDRAANPQFPAAKPSRRSECWSGLRGCYEDAHVDCGLVSKGNEVACVSSTSRGRRGATAAGVSVTAPAQASTENRIGGQLRSIGAARHEMCWYLN
jgi:hypothetical protein